MSHSQKPLVSIGLPTFNRPEGLQKTLEAIACQEYTNLEIIVSDNNSDDKHGIKAILENWASRDPRFKFFIQKSKIGVLNNFHFVAQKATGQYFLWMADDDIYYPNHISTMLEMHMQGNYVLTATIPSYYCTTTNEYITFYPIDCSQFGKSIEEQLAYFIRLHIWFHYKATIIYGMYKREYVPDVFSCPEFCADQFSYIGPDNLMVYSVLSKGLASCTKTVTYIKTVKSPFFYETIRKDTQLSFSKKIYYSILSLVGHSKMLTAIDCHNTILSKILDTTLMSQAEKDDLLLHNKNHLLCLNFTFPKYIINLHPRHILHLIKTNFLL